MKIYIQSLNNYFTSIFINSPISHKNITIYPLHSNRNREVSLVALDDALELNLIDIREMEGIESVNKIWIRNNSRLTVLVIEGTIINGMMQDRAVNSSLLIKAGSEVEAEVICVERGRWYYNNGKANKAKSHLNAALRAKKHSYLCESSLYERANQDILAQDAVWEHISDKAHRMNYESDTEALCGLYERNNDIIKPYRDNLVMPENTIGMIIEINGSIVGGEFFVSSSLFMRNYTSILSGYVIDALDERLCEGQSQSSEDCAKSLIEDILRSTKKVRRLSMGSKIVMSSDRIVGSSLVLPEAFIHGAVFINNKDRR
ncbi:cytoplasmic protein [Candidatus Magnetoovum chiemensis]|nr:cytoplasmic protein [Candidatus Magnetoovum chiemensis]